jgi:hypothetical protein
MGLVGFLCMTLLAQARIHAFFHFILGNLGYSSWYRVPNFKLKAVSITPKDALGLNLLHIDPKFTAQNDFLMRATACFAWADFSSIVCLPHLKLNITSNYA